MEMRDFILYHKHKEEVSSMSALCGDILCG